MKTLVTLIGDLHAAVFARVESALEGWFLGFFARFVFASVLATYFLNSAMTKVGDGLIGFLRVSDGAYYQIALPAVEAAGGDVSRVAFLPWGAIVWAGTYTEFLLPVLIVLGLFTRVAAIGMIVFVGVQTLVDVTVHQVGAETVGRLFDRFPDAAILDQRLLWMFPLAYLVVKGAGAVSLDALLARFLARTIPAGTSLHSSRSPGQA